MTENDDIYESAADELNTARTMKQIVSILNDYADLAQGNPELLQREEDLLAIVRPALYKVHTREERVLLNLPSIDADEVLGDLEGYAILRKNPSGYTAVCMDDLARLR